MKKFIPFLVCLLAFLAPVGASARIIGVPGDSPTIQAGIDASTPGDTVLVQPGRYLETIDFKGKDIVLGSLYITTQDTSYISKTIIDGNKNGTVVTFVNGETDKAELCGFTVTGGYVKWEWEGTIVDSPGGGIFCDHASPKLNHLIIEKNETYYYGGGIKCSYSQSRIENVLVRNNRANMDGGGLYFEYGDNKLFEVICCNNDASGNGNGIKLYDTSIIIIHGLFYKNISGQAIYSYGSKVVILNSTFTGHKAQNESVICCISTKIIFVNSILWNECKYEILAETEKQNSPNNVLVFYSNVKNNQTGVNVGENDTLAFENNIYSDPIFKNVGNDDYRLNSLSPCIDAGIAHYVYNNDTIINISSNSFHGNAPDIGFFEINDIISTINQNRFNTLKILNYPNPFNTSTSILFEVKTSGHYKINIYNIIGMKVFTLFDGNLQKGIHTLEWCARYESAGIYLYCFESEGLFYKGKMLLLK